MGYIPYGHKLEKSRVRKLLKAMSKKELSIAKRKLYSIYNREPTDEEVVKLYG